MAALDVYDNYYFRLNKKLLCILGLWPYDSGKKIIRTFMAVFVFVLSMPQFIAVIVDISNVDKLMEHLCIFIALFAVFLKHFTQIIAENKMKSVYKDIANNWLMITDEEEKRILIQYSTRGRIFTMAYPSLLTCTCGLFILLPLLPQVLNVINPLPDPRPYLYILNGKFLVENTDDYFLLIYFWDAATIIITIIIGVGIDSMYTVSVEHGTALYAIVTHRLSKLRRQMLSDSPPAKDSSYEWLVHTVKLHQLVLRFTSNINDSYSLCFFCLAILNIVDLPISCVIMMIHWPDPMNFFRWAAVFASLMLHLSVQFWPGQKLIDHSTRLLEDAYCNDWYETPAGTKKLLRIFMLRCCQPSLITAGGLVEMNFEIYLNVLKTAASYITVLASFR